MPEILSSQRERGTFEFRGPAGNWRRDDERIADDVYDHLWRHPCLDATRIDLAVEQGRVTLKGAVERPEERWIAENVTAAVAGVVDVRNCLREPTSH